jgi:hypothetical protein
LDSRPSGKEQKENQNYGNSPKRVLPKQQVDLALP